MTRHTEELIVAPADTSRMRNKSPPRLLQPHKSAREKSLRRLHWTQKISTGQDNTPFPLQLTKSPPVQTFTARIGPENEKSLVPQARQEPSGVWDKGWASLEKVPMDQSYSSALVQGKPTGNIMYKEARCPLTVGGVRRPSTTTTDDKYVAGAESCDSARYQVGQ